MGNLITFNEEWCIAKHLKGAKIAIERGADHCLGSVIYCDFIHLASCVQRGEIKQRRANGIVTKGSMVDKVYRFEVWRVD